ncbi:hypothetical protein [Magnetospirillum sp. SS-4]|uniref:hypothetical protein n=1 Tax=Magnetospirillum sp. SS-4 TaxID=2681465 RepID=UPI00137EA33B|nr:hypothetical protein [Magnetospirillum sp. SS-4]CAA7623639.1 conserved hypothetical protein [Magnetospirillum sp. SS-4]
MIPAHRVPPGSLVTATVDGRAVLCLKVERPGRDYINHYLVALTAGRRDLALIYIDPDTPLAVAEGAAIDLGEASGGYPDIGDAFATPSGTFLKLRDEPKAQKTFAYVDLATGLVRPRMERQAGGLVAWAVRAG